VKKGVSVTYVFTQINGNIVYRSIEHSHAPDTGTVAARRAVATMVAYMQLQSQKAAQGISLEMLLLGQVAVPKKTYRMTDERVSSIVRDYASRTFTEFLCAIAHNLRF